MNKNIIIVLAGGFLVAVLVAVLLQASLGNSKKEKDMDESRIQILVAAKKLSVGKELKVGDLKWKDWPEDAAFSGSIVRNGEELASEAAQGKLLRPLFEDQPMHKSLVSEEDKGDFLSANITKGMRAVGIPVKSHVLADRLMRPGDYVDVMVTYRVRVNSRSNAEAQSLVNKYATETVIENVRVLTVDTQDTKAVDEEEDDGKTKKRKKSAKKATLTLEVTPSDAEKLVLATKMGTIGIALRAIGDSADSKADKATTDVEMSSVMTKLSNMNGTSSAVRIYNGDQMSEVKARKVKEEGSVDFSMEDAPLPTQKIIISPEAVEQMLEEE